MLLRQSYKLSSAMRKDSSYLAVILRKSDKKHWITQQALKAKDNITQSFLLIILMFGLLYGRIPAASIETIL